MPTYTPEDIRNLRTEAACRRRALAMASSLYARKDGPDLVRLGIDLGGSMRPLVMALLEALLRSRDWTPVTGAAVEKVVIALRAASHGATIPDEVRLRLNRHRTRLEALIAQHDDAMRHTRIAEMAARTRWRAA